MKTCILLLVLLGSLAFADEERNFNIKTGKDRDHIIDQRKNYFQTSTPYKITPKVNPITGDLVEEETDL